MFRRRPGHPPYFCSTPPDEPCCDNLRRLREHHNFHRAQFMRHYKYFRYLRPCAVLFTLVILYLLFSWIGFKGLGLFFAGLLIAKEIIQFFFLLRLEKRILEPMEHLRQGLDEVAKGNYTVQIEYDKPNDLGLLISSFNEMAAKMRESERLKTEYEDNRKSLVANISHDLKTPITAIQGYVEALMDGTAASPENKERYLKTIHSNIVYVNRLIDDLFLFSKLDMQKLEFHFESVPIRAFMADLMEEYQFDLQERTVLARYVDKLDKDYCLRLDGKRFHQAFGNIIGNAVQHGPESGLSVTVSLSRQDDQIGIDILDNGPGIAEEQLPFIFDRFYRIQSERPKGSASTGLGLAIAKELIDAHGGSIRVASSKNKGTCFTILLPLLDAGKEAG